MVQASSKPAFAWCEMHYTITWIIVCAVSCKCSRPNNTDIL